MMLPKISAYVKTYDRQTKWMHFLIGYNELLEKYNTIWGKFTACIKRILIANLSIKKTTKKTRIKSHGDKVTDFYDKEYPTVDSNHTCLAVISLDSALKKYENHYPQVFLKKSANTSRKKLLDILLMTSKVSLMILMILID